MTFYAVITKEDAWYVATAVPSGVTSQGDTFEAAKKNLEEALQLYYEDEDVSEAIPVDPILTPLEVNLPHG